MNTKTVETQAPVQLQDGFSIIERYLEQRAAGVWEVVLVSNEWDRYNTHINPEGFKGSPATTSIFWNHGGAATGGVLKNVRVVENYETNSVVNGQPVILEKALVGEIHVSKKNQLNRRLKDGSIVSDGNMYEKMVELGDSLKVSVGLNPLKAKVVENGRTTIYDLKNRSSALEVQALEREGKQIEYIEYELPELSVLDVNSGQANSVTKRIRSKQHNNMSDMSESNNTKHLNELVKRDNRLAVITEEVERQEDGVSMVEVTLTYVDDASTENLSFNRSEEAPYERNISMGEYVLSQMNSSTEESDDESDDESGSAETEEVEAGEEESSEEENNNRMVEITSKEGSSDESEEESDDESDSSESEEANEEEEEETRGSEYEELRGFITKLTERLDALESSMTPKSESEEEDEEVANTTRKLESLQEEIQENDEDIAGVSQRQLGDNSNNQIDESHSDINPDVIKYLS